MKKNLHTSMLLTGLVLFFCSVPAHSMLTTHPGPGLPLEALKEMKLYRFAAMSAHDLSYLTGAKISLKERVSFSLLKWKMKKELKKNPDLTVGAFLAANADKGNKTVLIIVLVVLALLVIPLLAMYFSSAHF